MNNNKIKYGLKNVHYAIASFDDDGIISYGTPVAYPGAVSLSLEPQGENEPFYADNIVYYVGAANNGYEGDLEMARTIDSFKTDVLKYITDTAGVLFEDANPEAVHFALLFQFEGDKKATRHVLYDCTATRPSVNGETKGDTIEPQTETSTITASPVYNETLDKDIVKAETTPDSDSTVYDDWFDAVYLPQTSESE